MKRPVSMTAYGRGTSKLNHRPLTVEIRSVNHRYLDFRLKMSRRLMPLEERIKKVVAGGFSRGHVEVSIDSSDAGIGTVKLRPDLDLARQYHQSLQQVADDLGLEEKPTLQHLMNFKDIIVAEEEQEDIETIWEALSQALDEAVADARTMREAEGKNLRADLIDRLALLEKTLAAIETEIPGILKERQETLKNRLETLLDDSRLDPARMNQEAVILADRADVTEEIVRLKSHFRQFNEMIDQDEPVGRRLDFLLQEFFREINTMASKISNANIAHHTVTLKNEVEKMREQVQNIE